MFNFYFEVIALNFKINYSFSILESDHGRSTYTCFNGEFAKY